MTKESGPKADLRCGDCREVMRSMDADSIDSIVTDPPYGLSFMGKGWDRGVPGEEFWREAIRVAKPGAHLLAFGGTRTFHRLACAIEDAGWEIRDCVMWVYGSGFPKSHDVSKAIDKAAGAEREVVGQKKMTDTRMARAGFSGSTHSPDYDGSKRVVDITAPATPAAKQWHGWGTALKPAWEPVIVARKPLVGTVAENVLRYGTGAINVDGCRVGTDDNLNGGGYSGGTPKTMFSGLGRLQPSQFVQPSGRWPANLIHDGSEEAVGGFPEPKWIPGDEDEPGYWHAPAARFFYCAKASKADRDEGCEGLPMVSGSAVTGRAAGSAGALASAYAGTTETPRHNVHPTVKPTALMRYLCRLVTPPGGTVLDPFMGSGSTGKAAALEGFNFVGIDITEEYCGIALARIENALRTTSEELFIGGGE